MRTAVTASPAGSSADACSGIGAGSGFARFRLDAAGCTGSAEAEASSFAAVVLLILEFPGLRKLEYARIAGNTRIGLFTRFAALGIDGRRLSALPCNSIRPSGSIDSRSICSKARNARSCCNMFQLVSTPAT
jgi:hypothetical protein